jgi:hypothetical protein
MLNESLHGFPQSLQANSRIVYYIRPQMLPSNPIPIYYSMIILSFGHIQSELLAASLNKPLMANIETENITNTSL